MNDERPDRRDHESARDRRLEFRRGRRAVGGEVDRAVWVDLQVRHAIERGEFDGLPGTGKPIEDLDTTHDPDWWLKRFIERERISGVLPPALSLRVEDARLDDVLDAERSERRVRELLEDFNARIVEARRQLQGGPPVITATRDVGAEVEAWRERRTARRQKAETDRPPTAPPARRRSPWRRLLP